MWQVGVTFFQGGGQVGIQVGDGLRRMVFQHMQDPMAYGSCLPRIFRVGAMGYLGREALPDAFQYFRGPVRGGIVHKTQESLWLLLQECLEAFRIDAPKFVVARDYDGQGG